MSSKRIGKQSGLSSQAVTSPSVSFQCLPLNPALSAVFSVDVEHKRNANPGLNMHDAPCIAVGGCLRFNSFSTVLVNSAIRPRDRPRLSSAGSELLFDGARCSLTGRDGERPFYL